jgi:hypothetical protein
LGRRCGVRVMRQCVFRIVGFECEKVEGFVD